MVIYEVLPILKPSPPSWSGQTVAQVRAREYTRVRARVHACGGRRATGRTSAESVTSPAPPEVFHGLGVPKLFKVLVLTRDYLIKKSRQGLNFV